MTPHHADLFFNNIFGEGHIVGDDCANIVVRTHRVVPTEMTVWLMQYGQINVGGGMLSLVDGRWSGRVHEKHGGVWEVSMPVGRARLEFREHAEAAP